MPQPETIFADIEAYDPDLNARIEDAGGWRGMFDPVSAEWDHSTIDEKAELLQEITVGRGLPLRALVDACDAYWRGQDKAEIASEVPNALVEILQHMLNQEQCHD